jgi:hypothetical protein
VNYRIITKALDDEIEKELNMLGHEGWKPILMSTTPTTVNNQTPIAITIILERVSPIPASH